MNQKKLILLYERKTMISDCEEYGLRTPEIIQAKDFRTIIYRKGNESEHDEKISTPSEKVKELEE